MHFWPTGFNLLGGGDYGLMGYSSLCLCIWHWIACSR